MIVAAAFCPHPPLLVPAVAARAAAELADIRAAATAAVRAVADRGRLVLVGSGPVNAVHSPVARGSLRPYGVDLTVHLGSPACGGALTLPLSLTVGAWLVREAVGPSSGAVGFEVAAQFTANRAAVDLLALADSPDPVALVVMGDGSARSSERAPGYLDERAAPFNDAVARALADGDAGALETLDERLGDQLLAAGVRPWRVAGDLLSAAEYDARLDMRAEPYGVAYFVATWLAK